MLFRSHILSDGNQIVSVYYHLKRPGEKGDTPAFKVGEEITIGQKLGEVTGEIKDNIGGAHLHLGIRPGPRKAGTDARTERWYYPGYTTLFVDRVMQCVPDDAKHADILSEWEGDPLHYIDARSTRVGPISAIASGLTNPSALFVNGNDLYFGEIAGKLGTLSKVSKLGGNKILVAFNTALFDKQVWSGISRIDASPTHIYFGFGSYGRTRIDEILRDGVSRRTLAQIFRGGFLGTFGSSVHYFAGSCCMYRRAVADFFPATLTATNFVPRSSVKDGQTLFFVDKITKNLYRFHMSSTIAPVPLVTGNVAEGWAHTNSTSAFLGLRDVVKRVPKTGGTVNSIALPAGAWMRGVDSNFIYYTTENKQLWSMPIGGGAAQLLVERTLIPERVLSNGLDLYWIDTANGPANGRIMKLSGPDLSVDRRIVKIGEPVTLGWDTKGLDETRCRLIGGGIGSTLNPIVHDAVDDNPSTGSTQVNVHALTTFTLTCPTGIDTIRVEVVATGGES